MPSLCLALIRAALRNERGAVSIMIAICLPMLVGVMGLAAEASFWFLHQRAMQNAADAAAVAAANNGTSAYVAEAKSVAAALGFSDGTGNISVAVTNPATAPGCTAKCYSVSITDAVPRYLSPVVGYVGTVSVNGTGETRLASSAVATTIEQHPYCVLALASNGQAGITTDGSPKADLSGCNVMSNTTATCNGHNLNAPFGDAHGTNSGCGIDATSNVPTVSDPYSSLASNIPANPCNSYAQEPVKKKDPPLPPGNQWSGSLSLSGNTFICGDLQLTGNTTINAPNNAVVVIENGQLDTGTFTLNTTSGSGVTVVFSGTNGGTYQHAPTGGGTLDLPAPTSGDWSGVALYQDPAITTNVDISAAGNSPTWDISGLVYLPNSNVTFKGAVNKSNNGQSCFAMVVDTILIDGTGEILAHDGCPQAGLNLPVGGLGRGQLVN